MFTKNTKQLLNQNWQFTKQPLDVTDISQISPQTPWQTLTLPHDWLIYDTTNLYEDSVGFYKRTFVVNSDLPKHFLRFNGVYMDCSVFVNEKHVGDWKYGYTGFEFEITEHLQKGENRVLVRAIHEKNNSRWYSGAGIYRDVYLVSTNETYIPYGGVYISSKKNDGDEWSVNIETEIAGNTSGVEVKHKAYYKDEHLEDLSCVKNPLLWSVDSPNIYTMVTEVFKNNALVHTEQNTFGFREISFRKEEGFFLNGKQMKIQGVCQHHDLGALGAAFSKSALKRQFELLKEMGVNGLRAAHNPPDPYFMELADSMGFVVVSELFDIWERPKTQNDYSRFFGEWWKKDVAAWVKRDRNHPSLIMWSIGNEVYDTHADPVRGGEILTMLSKAVREYDPNKNAPITLCSNYLPWENTQKVADMLEEPKLVGYNYGEYLYEDHNKTKDWIIYGSETGSVVQSRGIYHFPLSQSVLADDDEQCSSLGNSATSWGAKSTQACIITDRDTPFSLGQFIWTGTDYIGEPTPYHTKNSYFGQIDTAGFKKDSFYIYQSAWTDYKKSPMIHIFPYWDFSPGQMIDVQVASNAPIVELFLNGQTQGTFEIDHKNGKKIIAAWRIPYQKGELKAVGYDKKGNVIAEQTKKSFGCAKNLQITETVYDDLVFAQICAFDENGIEVENANNPVIVEVTDGKLLGLDNGDSTDYDQYVGSKKRLFSGKLLAIATKGSKISAKFDEEVPIRKIELVRSGYKVKAVTYPANATHKDLHWRVTCAAGIDTNIADFAISECGRELTLTPRGDGEIFVRCSTKNGRNKISLISYLDFVITGLGKAYLDPYGFVAGGLYNKSNMPLTNGNERGVATLRDGQSHVGFADLDFGDIGADEIHLPIFAMTQEHFPIEVWEGMPEQGGEKITELTYKSGSKWNTYITESYKLPRKLVGITTMCFVVNKKIHIKGFSFTKEEKAYKQLHAADFTKIYGDSYEIEQTKVTGIGNNVTIDFADMNFKKGNAILQINGRGSVNNTIHLKQGDNKSQILEFPKTDDYITKEFEVETVGENTVTFVFLPGSNFDFAWLKFVENRR